MTPEQENELVGGGECQLHTHRLLVSHTLLEGLQDTQSVASKTANFTANLKDDFNLVSTSGGPVTATLPLARGNRLITFVKTAGASTLTLTASGTDTINGGASLVISSNYAPVRLLAVTGVGYIQV